MGLGAMIAAAAASAAKAASNATSKSSGSSPGSSGSTSGSSSSTSTGSGGAVYQVSGNGSAETGIKYNVGDQVVTGGGTYTVTGVDGSGNITDRALSNQNQTTYNYSGTYANPHDGSNIGTSNLTASTAQDTGTAGVLNGYDSAYTDYQSQMQTAQDASEAAIAAKTQQAVNDLEAQKTDVQKAGKAANQSAYDAYMQVLNPNGGLAESLAAQGLLSSGLTESSQISAGNTYQNAINSNGETVQTQLAEIARAITNAQLSGDYETAQSLASYAETVAAAGLTNAQNVAAYKQWATENAQTQAQNAFSNNIASQQLEMQQQAAQDTHDSTSIANDTAKLQLEILQTTGMTAAQLANQIAQYEAQGYSYDNALKQLQIKYFNS